MLGEPKTNSPSPAERSVHSNAKKPNFYQLSVTKYTVALLLSYIIHLLGCAPNPPEWTRGPRITSVANLHDIGLAIKGYRDKNGKWPNRLSELVPSDVPVSKIAIFYPPDKPATNRSRPPGWDRDVSLLDDYGSYVYVAAHGPFGIVAYERFDLWKPTGSHFDGKLAVLYTDGRVDMVPASVLKKQVDARGWGSPHLGLGR